MVDGGGGANKWKWEALTDYELVFDSEEEEEEGKDTKYEMLERTI